MNRVLTFGLHFGCARLASRSPFRIAVDRRATASSMFDFWKRYRRPNFSRVRL